MAQGTYGVHRSVARNHAPMSSSSVASDSGAEEEATKELQLQDNVITADSTIENGSDGIQHPGARIAQLLEEEKDEPSTPVPLGNGINRYRAIHQADGGSENGSTDALPNDFQSPVGSFPSNPDDTPSIAVCYYCICSSALLTYCWLGFSIIFACWE